ncbi:hypothetical protein BYT27DRAFT_7203717 [Phlegmacium glaucopus]|nr:hypothetical protein BYT27DRAFT_7203717 [Phlegmacium glaucopus]
MSDNQTALNILVESCKAALIAINSDDPAQRLSDFPTLRKDFLSLLSLIHASSTKVALALKPSSPQYKAALTPLKDLSNNVAALVHSIHLMRRDQSATLLKEYTSLVQTVIEAVKSLAQMFLDSTGVTEEYLVRTGTVHDLIDMARKPGGLSLTTRDAVRKRWLQNHESIVDGAEEIQQLCKPATSEDPEGDDFIDDGWEELGINSTIKLSPAELDRTEKVQAVIKLVVLLHKRVLRDVLSPDAPECDNVTYDALVTLSTNLLTASDDFISSMYAPHQLPNVTVYLQSLRDVIKEFQRILLPSQNNQLSVEEQLNALELSPRLGSDKSRKWFKTCFEQVEILGAKIAETLEPGP